MNLDPEIQLQLSVTHRGNGSTEEAAGLTWVVREAFLEEVTFDQVNWYQLAGQRAGAFLAGG